MWNLPRPGIEPMSPGLACRFLTPRPPGKSQLWHFFKQVYSSFPGVLFGGRKSKVALSSLSTQDLLGSLQFRLCGCWVQAVPCRHSANTCSYRPVRTYFTSDHIQVSSDWGSWLGTLAMKNIQAQIIFYSNLRDITTWASSITLGVEVGP